jgi:hypothetical protein
MKPKSILLFGGLVIATLSLSEPRGHAAAAPAWNRDESKVIPYTLPDVLKCEDGTIVRDVKTWREKRRLEILQAYFTNMYGRTPAVTTHLRFEITKVDPKALDGLATRKEITIHLFDDPAAPTIALMLYIPNQRTKPAPAFLGLNYFGNQCVHPDPSITASTLWMRPMAANGVVNNRATEATRGTHALRWPLELALKRGYAVATYYYGDLEPDHADGWKTGLRGYLLRREGRTELAADEWGALGVWAWGLSRAMDYLVTDAAIDPKQVAVFGHSRHGKTALWCGAQDERFAIVISNDSGEGGASLSRRNFGETIAVSLHSAAYWYCGNYRKFSDRADALPTDQHMLLALAAPRPLYVASAEKDALADPKGEFLSAVHAAPVYRLYGLTGLGVTEMPGVEHPIGDTIGYHLRAGEHNILAYDWEQFMTFADRHYRRR